MHKLGSLSEMGEEFVKFGLNALAHANKHDGDRHGHFASADEGVACVGVAGARCEGESRNTGNEANNDGNDMGAARSASSSSINRSRRWRNEPFA